MLMNHKSIKQSNQKGMNSTTLMSEHVTLCSINSELFLPQFEVKMRTLSS